MIVLGVFFLYPSFKMFVGLLIALIMGHMRTPMLHVCVFSGLPYGKMAPVLLARKPWWQTLFFPLDAEMRSLWTAAVRSKSARTLDIIGRVRLLLVGNTWYLQCGDPKMGWRVDVRAPFASSLWRTCYTCPAGDSMMPPPSADGGGKSCMGDGKKAENTTLHLEVDTKLAKEWMDRRLPK